LASAQERGSTRPSSCIPHDDGGVAGQFNQDRVEQRLQQADHTKRRGTADFEGMDSAEEVRDEGVAAGYRYVIAAEEGRLRIRAQRLEFQVSAPANQAGSQQEQTAEDPGAGYD